LRNADIEELFGLVEIGDPVDLYAERTDEVARIFGAQIAVVDVAPGSTLTGAAATGGQ
jgi:hypothetical protein